MTGAEVGAAADGMDSPAAAPAIPEDRAPDKSIQAQRWNELYNLARLIADTEIVPKPLRRRPDAIFAVMASAEERGITPLTGLQNIDLIDGRPAPSAMLQRSMIQRAGHVLQWRRFDRQAAVLYGRRRDTGADAEATFTIDDARDMKLTSKGNWATMPRAMLMARVTSLLGRMLFADVLLGMEYTPEELGAVGPYAAIDLEYEPGDNGVDLERPANVDENGVITDPADPEDAAWVAAAKGDELDQQVETEERRIESAYDPDPEAD